jgi:choline kinase/phosphatidylglycerophosphate synthase
MYVDTVSVNSLRRTRTKLTHRGNSQGRHRKIKEALILAAGNGRRLNGYQHGRPKPLVKVAGRALLERVILTAKQRGIERFVIVVGYKGDEIQRWIDSRNLGVEIEWVTNPEWKKKSNGVSLLVAEGHIGSPFAVFMADHQFNPQALDILQENAPEDGESVVVVDRRLEQIFDLEDATKVKLREEKPLEVGKGLSEFQAIDTGIFVFSENIFPALRTSYKSGDCTLSDGVNHLARQGQIRAVEIGDLFWQDVDTKQAAKHAERMLVRSTRKPSDGPISKALNRPISNWVTRLLLRTAVTPNQISVANFLMALVGAVGFATGHTWGVVLGGVMMQLTSILDGCDGEVAQVKMTESKEGAALDTIMDNASYLSWYVGVGLGAHFAFRNPILDSVLAASSLMLLAALTLSFRFIHSRGSHSMRDFNRAVVNASNRRYGRLFLFFRRLRFISRRDFFSFGAFLLSLTGSIAVMFGIFVAVALVFSTGTMIALRAMSRRVRKVHQAMRYAEATPEFQPVTAEPSL